ncbi:MAG: NAD-dependent epimerase/dehydratase family protein [Verrucomicrobia bacterium]|nr:NAD-dependent epimerase/dehydratase family protein [Verrucomicrobiota bacterium]
MKVLIAGICGFVGSSLARWILNSSPATEIVGIDNLMRSGSEVNRHLGRLGIRVIHGDIRNRSDVENLPATEWIVDAAANPSVLAGVDRRSSSRQVVEHNLLGSVNLLEHCVCHNAGFTLLSTSRVYSIKHLKNLKMQINGRRFVPELAGDRSISNSGITEQFPTTAPISFYGATKLASEVLALEYGNAFNFPVRINRCGVVAGAGQFGTAEQGIFSYWVHAWHAKHSLRYTGFNGQGLQVRDALHPDDLADLVWRQMNYRDNGQERICNVSGGLANSMSLLELSDWCTDRFGAGKVGEDSRERPFDLPWIVLDSARAETLWKWRPSRTLPSILSEISEHAIANPSWLDLSSSNS